MLRRITILKNLSIFAVLIILSLTSYKELSDEDVVTTLPDKNQVLCVINAISYEAGNQHKVGQRAVFDVVENRSKAFDKDWCSVVKQKHQFSFYPRKWKNKLDKPDWKLYYDIVIAHDRVLGVDVLFYHADYVNPVWSKKLVKDQKIGNHIFYKLRSET